MSPERFSLHIVDRRSLINIFTVGQDELLLLNCFALSNNCLRLLQRECWVCLQALRQRAVSDPHNEPVTDHLRLEVSALAVFDEVVEAGDILFRRFSLALIPAVESRALEDFILADLKEIVQFLHNSVYLLSVLSLALADVRTSSASSPRQ